MEQNNYDSLKKMATSEIKKTNILRPSTDNQNLPDEINPELERNQSSVAKSDVKLNLNVNAKSFIPKSMRNLYKENKVDYKHDSIKSSINTYKMPYQEILFIKQGKYYPQEFAFPSNSINVIYPINNPNYNTNYNIQQNIKKNNLTQKKNNEPKKTVTTLKIDSKKFIPKTRKVKKEIKDEIKDEKKEDIFALNIFAGPFIPRNSQLKQKKDIINPNKEEKSQKCKHNPLDILVSNSTIKTENSNKIKEEEDNNEEDLDFINKDLRNLLKLLEADNYNIIKSQIFEKIKDDINIQNQFSEILFRQAISETEDKIELYSKLVKDLDNELPQKNESKEKNKKAYSIFRTFLIDKCRTFFQNIEKFDSYINEKDTEGRNNKLKKLFLGNINFISGLIKIIIISKKVGPDCLKNLYDRYQRTDLDKTMRELALEALIVFTEKFGRIIYEQYSAIKEEDKEEYLLIINNIFKKLKKIKKEKDLSRYIKNNIINLELKRKNNFLENKGQISQNNINLRMRLELNDYKEYLKTGEKEEKDIWKETTFIIENRTTYGKTFGDILEGYFENAAEIMKEEDNPEYLKNYLYELIDYYYENFSKNDIKELRRRLISLFNYIIIDIGSDIPHIYDLYAYVLNLFMEYQLINFNDLSKLNKKEANIANLVDVFKNLKKYYKKYYDFKDKLEKIPYIKDNKKKFEWAFN